MHMHMRAHAHIRPPVRSHPLWQVSLLKPSAAAVGGVLDLGKLGAARPSSLASLVDECNALRRPPMLPSEFDAALASKSFARPNPDLPLVSRLYRREFQTQMTRTTRMLYGSLRWGDAEVRCVSSK